MSCSFQSPAGGEYYDESSERGCRLKSLAGFSIVNVGVNLPGPLASYQLEQLGASVIKVEPPQGDPLQFACPEFYKFISQSQEIISLDLKSKNERQTLDSYLEKSDLLITSSRPEALAKLSLDWDYLRARHPRLCVIHIFGFASPNQNKAGHDLTYQAMAGLLTPPNMPSLCIADFAGAHAASLRGASLLLARERTGVAEYAEVSLYESAQWYGWAAKFELTSPPGPLSGALPEYRIYQAKSGWVAVAALEDHFKTQLQALLEIDEISENELKRTFRKHTASEWQTIADENNLPIAEVILPAAEDD